MSMIFIAGLVLMFFLAQALVWVYLIFKSPRTDISARGPAMDTSNATLLLFQHQGFISSLYESASDAADPGLNDGRIGSLPWSELAALPKLHPAVIGTVVLTVPSEWSSAVIAVLDNQKLNAMGYDSVPLSPESLQVLDRYPSNHCRQPAS